MASKVTIFFQGAAVPGWSETFWYNGSMDTQSINIFMNGLFAARAAILTNSCKMTHATMQSGTSRLVFTFIPANGPVFGGESPPTVESEVALLVKLQAVGPPPYFNRPFLRGIPARIVSGDSYTPDPVFLANFTQFANRMTSPPVQISGLLTTPPQPIVNISTITPAPPRGYRFTSTVGAFAIGDILRVRNCVVPGYNGLKRVVNVDATGAIYTVGGAAPAAPEPVGAQTAQKQIRWFAQATQAIAESITRRAAGRPFGLSRGRKATLYSLRR